MPNDRVLSCQSTTKYVYIYYRNIGFSKKQKQHVIQHNIILLYGDTAY